MTLSKSAHPVSAGEYHNQLGGPYRRLAAQARAEDRQVLLVNSNLVAPGPAAVPFLQPARSSLPFALVTKSVPSG